MRLGTFNVNGKMPSQDLSAWVQASFVKKLDGKGTLRSENVSLSPLQKFSPLSLPNPLDWSTRVPFLILIICLIECPPPVSRRKNSSEKVTGTLERPMTIPIPMRVDEVDPDDPDLFVFAFQELDLSTEALLYSSSTTREDAWCYAIFAALGEKGVRYEKVSAEFLQNSTTPVKFLVFPPVGVKAAGWHVYSHRR